MALVGIRTPHEVARLLGGLDVPGDRVPGEEKHITLLNMGDDLPIDQISKAVTAIHGVTSALVPFRVMLDHASTFPGGANGVPIICPVTSPELHTLHDLLKKALDTAGVAYSKKFPEFKPHVTLAYAKEEEVPLVNQSFGPLEWSIYEIVLWGGDSGDERLSVTFPFSLPGKTALFRHLVQAQLRLGSRA